MTSVDAQNRPPVKHSRMPLLWGALIAALGQVSRCGRARRLLPPLPSPLGCAPARVMLALRITKFAAMAAPVLLGEALPLLG